MALLHLLHLFRIEPGSRREKAKFPFSIHPIHIDEMCVSDSGYRNGKKDAGNRAHAIQKVAQCTTVPLEYIYITTSDTTNEESIASKREKSRYLLANLLQSIPDSTAKDDIITILKTHLLLRTAHQLDCKLLVVGTTTDAMAAKIIAASAKGCGYSLPCISQAIDDRYAPQYPCIVHAMRDISKEEINALCRGLGIITPDDEDSNNGENKIKKTTAAAAAALHTSIASVSIQEENNIDKSNINELAMSFIDTVMRHNPGSIFNIMSTVSKLEEFSVGSTAREQGSGAGLCGLCSGPLAQDEEKVCDSCLHGIFGIASRIGLNGVVETRVYEYLPDDIRQRIQRCLFN